MILSDDSMKHDAIVGQGIAIHERVEIPDELIPEDSRVEIDAKIHAGYCKSSVARQATALLTNHSHQGHCTDERSTRQGAWTCLG